MKLTVIALMMGVSRVRGFCVALGWGTLHVGSRRSPPDTPRVVDRNTVGRDDSPSLMGHGDRSDGSR